MSREIIVLNGVGDGKKMAVVADKSGGIRVAGMIVGMLKVIDDELREFAFIKKELKNGRTSITKKNGHNDEISDRIVKISVMRKVGKSLKTKTRKTVFSGDNGTNFILIVCDELSTKELTDKTNDTKTKESKRFIIGDVVDWNLNGGRRRRKEPLFGISFQHLKDSINCWFHEL